MAFAQDEVPSVPDPLLIAPLDAAPVDRAPIVVPPSRSRGRIENLRVAQQPTQIRRPEEVRIPAPSDAGERSPVRPSPFRSDQVRLNTLGVRGTPQPTPEIRAKYDRFIDSRIDTENTLDLVEGRPTLLVFRQVPFRVQIASEEIASYTLITEREFSIVGNQTGSTVLNFWFLDPDQPGKQDVLSYLVRVVPDPELREQQELRYQALEQELNRNFPDSVVHLSLLGDKLLVRGQAHDVDDADGILEAVYTNAPGGAEDVPLTGDANEVDLTLTESTFGQTAGSALPYATGPLSTNGVTQIIAASPKPPSRVINRLRVAGHQQIMLKVSVAEVDRRATRAIGANLSIGDVGSAARFLSFIPTGGITAPATGGTLLVNTGDFDLALNALKTLNLARGLAEPNLSTLNGRPARLQVGGSFPVPTTIQSAVGNTVQNVAFVQFGVIVTFVPVITDKNRIRLQMLANVSDTDPSNAATIGGTTVPGLSTRNFQSTVELREGQTLAVAGLIRNTYNADSSRVPFVGETPILGQLFGRSNTSSAERELIFLVTPYLTAPLDSTECLPLPGADIFEPDDIEFYVMGHIEGHVAEDYRTAVRTDMAKMSAFQKLQHQYIIGPSGHSDGQY